MKIQNVVVTGGAGFIGKNLVDRLISEGANVIVLDDLSTGIRENIDLNEVSFINCDLSSFNCVGYISSTIDELVGEDGVNIIYHLASPCSVIQFKDPVVASHKTLMSMSNAISIAGMFESTLIYPSSGNVYGTAPAPQRELSIPQPTNMYAVCKLASEQMAMLSGVSSCGLRIFLGYGPYEKHKGNLASVVTNFLVEMMNNRQPVIWGDGNQVRDFIYIDDIVDGLIKASGYSGVEPILNLGTGNATSFNTLIDIINDELGTKILPKYVSKPKSYVENTVADITLMQDELGLRPIDLRRGIKKYINFLTEESK